MPDPPQQPPEPYEAPPTLPLVATCDTIVIYKGILGRAGIETWTPDEVNGKVKHKRRWFGS